MMLYWRIFNDRYTSRIEFWIVLFFVIRLIGITNAPLEIAHNWRQVTGLMVARNFYETDASLFYPRIDDTQGGTGIIGMEFPLLNYLHYLMALIFDYDHWYGRLINLIISSIGVFYFYKTLRLLFTEKVAFYASYVLLVSSWFAFSRKMMPDTFCISLMFIAVYNGLKYLHEGKIANILWYFVFATLAILSKIPAGIYLSIFLPFIFLNKPSVNQISWFVLFTVFSLVISGYWYFVWCPYLSETYGQWYNTGMSLNDGFIEVFSHFSDTSRRFYFDAFSGFIAFGVFLIGVYFLYNKGEKLFVLMVSILSIVFFFYMLKSGYFFHHHTYYILPFVPVMAMVVGFLFSLFENKKTLIVSLLILITLEGVANQQHDFFLKESEKYKLNLESFLDLHISRENKIAINGNGNPQLLYLSHRKGWVCSDNQVNELGFLKSLKLKGCEYLMLVKNENRKYNLHLTLISSNKFVEVYKL